MTIRRILWAVFLPCLFVGALRAQDASAPALSSSAPPFTATIPLTVPPGTTLQVALHNEVRIKKVGQPIQGRLVEPVYAFDQEVLPVGAEVRGRISAIKSAPGMQRFLSALNADFSPVRAIEVEFEEIFLPDGTHIPIRTIVTPGSGQPLQLVTTVDHDKKTTAKDVASQKMKEAVHEAKQKWESAMGQVKRPGKMRRLGRYAVARLPVHPQYIDAGTVYFAELQAPLDFGSKLYQPAAAMETSPPPCNLLAHAQLLTPLDSATSHQDDPIEAVLSQPLFSGDQLILPQGTRLKGSVLHVQPARRFARHGQLRLLFQEVVPPDGVSQTVDTSLEGIQAGQDQNVRLDLEGGTKPTSSKKRYLRTGLSVAAAVRAYEDSDTEDGVSSSNGSVSRGATAGAAGYRLIGLVAGAFARSGPFAMGLGIFGASRSAYSDFVARGQEVAFPKGTAMEVGLWLSEDCVKPVAPVEAGKAVVTENKPQGGSQ